MCTVNIDIIAETNQKYWILIKSFGSDILINNPGRMTPQGKTSLDHILRSKQFTTKLVVDTIIEIFCLIGFQQLKKQHKK